MGGRSALFSFRLELVRVGEGRESEDPKDACEPSKDEERRGNLVALALSLLLHLKKRFEDFGFRVWGLDFAPHTLLTRFLLISQARIRM